MRNNKTIEIPVKQYYTRENIAAITGWSLSTIYNYKNTKGLEFRHFGMIRHDEWIAFVEGIPIKEVKVRFVFEKR